MLCVGGLPNKWVFCLCQHLLLHCKGDQNKDTSAATAAAGARASADSNEVPTRSRDPAAAPAAGANTDQSAANQQQEEELIKRLRSTPSCPTNPGE